MKGNILTGQADKHFIQWLISTGKGRPNYQVVDMLIDTGGGLLTQWDKLPEIFKQALLLDWLRTTELVWSTEIGTTEILNLRHFENWSLEAQRLIIQDAVRVYNEIYRELPPIKNCLEELKKDLGKIKDKPCK